MPSIPIVKAKLGIFTYIWTEENINLRLDHLRESHDVVSAEATIQHGDLHLHQARINLVSTPARVTLAKYLTSRQNNLDWGGMLEQCLADCLCRFRQGEPPVHIGQLPIRTAPKWRLWPIIPERQLAVLFGAGGHGKSTLGAAMACSISMGHPMLSWKPIQGNVLFLDWETNQDDMNDMLKALEAGLELPQHPDIIYRRMSRPLVNDIEQLQAWVLEYQIDCIFVDSARKAAGGEREARENAGPTLNALRSLDKSVLIITHEVKDPDAPKSPYGSGLWTDDPRHVIVVKGHIHEDEDRIDLGLFRYKSNLLGSLHPMGYQIQWCEAGIKILEQNVEDVPELAEKLSVRLRIIKLLTIEKRFMAPNDITKELSVKPELVRRELYRGKDRDFVSQKINAKTEWGLLYQGETVS